MVFPADRHSWIMPSSSCIRYGGYLCRNTFSFPRFLGKGWVCSHHSLPCQSHVTAVGCAAQLQEAHLPRLPWKRCCLPLGAGVLSTTSTKSSSWEFIFWLPLSEQTDIFRLLRNKTRIAFSIHWIYIGGEDNMSLEYIKYSVIQHIFWH